MLFRSLLVRGEQSLSIDMAMRLSRMIGTSVNYWLNLQNAYDALIAEFKSEQELVEERKIFENFDYKFFRENYGLPDLPRKKDEQIKEVRRFLNVATLTVLSRRDIFCGIFEKFFKNFVACVQLFKYNKKLLTFFCFQIKKIHTLYAKPRFKTGGSYEKF